MLLWNFVNIYQITHMPEENNLHTHLLERRDFWGHGMRMEPIQDHVHLWTFVLAVLTVRGRHIYLHIFSYEPSNTKWCEKTPRDRAESEPRGGLCSAFAFRWGPPIFRSWIFVGLCGTISFTVSTRTLSSLPYILCKETAYDIMSVWVCLSYSNSVWSSNSVWMPGHWRPYIRAFSIRNINTVSRVRACSSLWQIVQKESIKFQENINITISLQSDDAWSMTITDPHTLTHLKFCIAWS
jgi:hypothetical protein